MPYTRINWVNGSGGGTPLSAANLNIMDLGLDTVTDTAEAALPKAAGTGNPLTDVLQVNRTLSGSAKEFNRYVASDGKTYALRLTTAGELEVFNVTDAVSVLKFGPTANLIGGGTNWTSANDGSGSGLDADTLRTKVPNDFVQVGSGNEAGPPVLMLVTDVLPAAGTKGRIAFKTPFAMP